MRPSGSLNSSSLQDYFGHQDQQFEAAFSILREAIAARAFPAASIAVTHQAKLIALHAFGNFTYELGASRLPGFARRGDHRVDTTTLFDLASLTKVVSTTSMAMLLYDRGLLDLDAPVGAIVPEFLGDAERDSRRNDVTLRMLLTHSSGLPAYEKLFLKAKTRNDLVHAAFTTALTADPGSRAEYSDIGFIILGAALECLADESLDHFCQRKSSLHSP